MSTCGVCYYWQASTRRADAQALHHPQALHHYQCRPPLCRGPLQVAQRQYLYCCTSCKVSTWLPVGRWACGAYASVVCLGVCVRAGGGRREGRAWHGRADEGYVCVLGRGGGGGGRGGGVSVFLLFVLLLLALLLVLVPFVFAFLRYM